jgi:uncharacterized membrane protein
MYTHTPTHTRIQHSLSRSLSRTHICTRTLALAWTLLSLLCTDVYGCVWCVHTHVYAGCVNSVVCVSHSLSFYYKYFFHGFTSCRCVLYVGLDASVIVALVGGSLASASSTLIASSAVFLLLSLLCTLSVFL